MRIGTLLLAGILFVWPLGLSAQTQSTAPVAIVNGKPISSELLEKEVGSELSKLEQQIYDLKKDKLDAMVEDALIQLEALKRKITKEELIDREVNAKLAPISDEDVAVFYGANQARLQKDLNSWKTEIRAYLTQQRTVDRRKAFAAELRAAGKVEILLPEPKVFRASIPLGSAFSKGNSAAPVTIVEYGDFHCPFCKRVQPTVAQVLTKYGDKVRLVYKDFPLDNLHPQARGAAEAARCAAEQGRFWEFHDKIYAGDPDSSLPMMKRYAQEVGIADMTKFEACVSLRKYQTQVQADLTEGAKLGVNGTPGFFINGRFLSGAQPIEEFAKIIDAELAQQQSRQ